MKDAYYFSHDANAHNDPNIIIMMGSLGLEGYGLYWIIIEMLRDQKDYMLPVSVLPGIARMYGTTNDKIAGLLKNFNLFVIEDDFFYSKSLISRMKHFEDKRKKLSEAGKKGNLVRWGSPSDGNEIASKVKYSKVKESKVKEIKEEYTFGEFVKMSIEEHKKLIDSYGDKKTNDMLQTLDNYKGSSGKKYKSDYRAILSWVVDKTQSPKKSIFPEKETPQEYTNRMRQEGYKYEKIETNTGYTYQWIK